MNKYLSYQLELYECMIVLSRRRSVTECITHSWLTQSLYHNHVYSSQPEIEQ